MRTRRTQNGPVAVLLATVMSGGCSLAFVEGPPPERERRHEIDCTTGSVAPIADVTLAVLGLFTALGVAEAGGGAFGGTHTSHVAYATSGLVLTGLTATSAGIGFARISACVDAKAAESGAAR